MIDCDNCGKRFNAEVMDGICPNCGSDNTDRLDEDGDYEDD
jgi:Zn finger protein HypA/HybF involved in hydrogenase expression